MYETKRKQREREREDHHQYPLTIKIHNINKMNSTSVCGHKVIIRFSQENLSKLSTNQPPTFVVIENNVI
ncbi:hypothetical protein PRUPE_6G004000 [Prunus persica]|uniref:Uncharacterized protein n=1 Tax=Prunus persica TaxID=3760 RepID=A0A251NI53_PRUPE|nr:hypothetical protein PRUPE_6G004000 [Prunus persica]